MARCVNDWGVNVNGAPASALIRQHAAVGSAVPHMVETLSVEPLDGVASGRWFQADIELRDASGQRVRQKPASRGHVRLSLVPPTGQLTGRLTRQAFAGRVEFHSLRIHVARNCTLQLCAELLGTALRGLSAPFDVAGLLDVGGRQALLPPGLPAPWSQPATLKISDFPEPRPGEIWQVPIEVICLDPIGQVYAHEENIEVTVGIYAVSTHAVEGEEIRLGFQRLDHGVARFEGLATPPYAGTWQLMARTFTFDWPRVMALSRPFTVG